MNICQIYQAAKDSFESAFLSNLLESQIVPQNPMEKKSKVGSCNTVRPIPAAKSTEEKDLYGRLSELDITSEDWIIIDPKDNDIRESATANLIFVQGNNLIIPEKRILQGITLRHLISRLQDSFSIIRSSPLDQDISQFDEVLLCGTGRGVAPLTSLPELGWSSRSNDVFTEVRLIYEQLISGHECLTINLMVKTLT
jgi:hypothetical protein